jgi:hypothetical protein
LIDSETGEPVAREGRTVLVADEVMKIILETYEAGDMITMCAWCRRVHVAGEWVPAPKAALTAIDSVYALSHSICPACAAGPAASAA